jgi:uncharacterized cofD-like protein
LVPPDAEPPIQALEAIAAADQVVVGPGSLFTSVLAVLAVPALSAALRDTKAHKVYVCNLRPQPPETAAFDGAAHVRALLEHDFVPDVALCDPARLPPGAMPVPWVERPLAREDGLAHDPGRLADALRELLE